MKIKMYFAILCHLVYSLVNMFQKSSLSHQKVENFVLCLESLNGSCSAGEFKCQTGAKCLPARWTCDGGTAWK